MGRLLISCKQQLQAAGDPRASQLPIPPVFNHCKEVLGEAQQQQARDLYWKAVSSPELQGPQHAQQVLGLYEQAVELNPYMAEPHLMLAQLHVQAGRWEAAEAEARRALLLFLQWGTPYDKVGCLCATYILHILASSAVTAFVPCNLQHASMPDGYGILPSAEPVQWLVLGCSRGTTRTAPSCKL